MYQIHLENADKQVFFVEEEEDLGMQSVVVNSCWEGSDVVISPDRLIKNLEEQEA